MTRDDAECEACELPFDDDEWANRHYVVDDKGEHVWHESCCDQLACVS